MKQLPLQSPSFAYAERGFGQWLDILGYAPATVYNMPNAVRELLHWMEAQGKTQLHQLTSVNISDYYDHLRERENITRGGGLSNAYLNKHQQAIKLFAEVPGTASIRMDIQNSDGLDLVFRPYELGKKLYVTKDEGGRLKSVRLPELKMSDSRYTFNVSASLIIGN